MGTENCFVVSKLFEKEVVQLSEIQLSGSSLVRQSPLYLKYFMHFFQLSKKDKFSHIKTEIMMSSEGCTKIVHGPDPELFDNWVHKNYGGNSRTKTITREKYMRICALLRGEQTNSNAKFRFWVRSKGFRLLRYNRTTDEIFDDVNGQLYVSLHAKEVSIVTFMNLIHLLYFIFNFS